MSMSFPAYFSRPRVWWRELSRSVANRMPKGLYARSLLIVILPMVILQSVVTYTFMERHWQLVTFRLSAAVVQDIGAMIDLYQADPRPEMLERLAPVASKRLGLDIEIMRGDGLPPALPKPFFSLLDSALSREISVLIARPILRLAGAAEAFGKGRDAEIRPHGAREVRQAAYAFLEMRRRIERTIEQRTAMLNGVSHDLRTILTRFKLSLALMGEGAELDAMQKDVEEMQRMLEAYLSFARGDSAEPAAPTDMRAMLDELKADAERHGHVTQVDTNGDMMATVRPDAFKRCLANLVSNAQRYGDRIAIVANREQRWFTIHVDDDGPGIPPERREDVFRPFYRLDEARNQDEGGTGLGLAIARDIARSHGGDIDLGQSPMGGLRATVRIPV